MYFLLLKWKFVGWLMCGNISWAPKNIKMVKVLWGGGGDPESLDYQRGNSLLTHYVECETDGLSDRHHWLNDHDNRKPCQAVTTVRPVKTERLREKHVSSKWPLRDPWFLQLWSLSEGFGGEPPWNHGPESQAGPGEALPHGGGGEKSHAGVKTLPWEAQADCKRGKAGLYKQTMFINN